MQTCSPTKRSVSAMARTRAEGMRDWIKENASTCVSEQKHLDEGTTERAYWHYGYLSALSDILRLMASEN